MNKIMNSNTNAVNDAMERYLGIDLGTTNTAAAVSRVRNGRLETVPQKITRFTRLGKRGAQGQAAAFTLPSCVLFDESLEGGAIVGDAARSAARHRPYAVAVSVKSQMGRPGLSYPDWSADYPDQTPQDISARILRQVLTSYASSNFEEAREAVITVPASFGVAQREATLMAAEKAGLQVRDEKGGYRDDILLPEPEAVIYAALNQEANNEIDLRTDFKEPKNVMVYDIGGGTLDITLHTVTGSADTYDIRAIATNRFSTVAGNAFDERIAEAMFEKFLAQMEEEDPAAARRIRANRARCMAYLRSYAEQVKTDINDRYAEYAAAGRSMPGGEYAEYGGEMPDGLSVEDIFTREEFEACLAPLMGGGIPFEAWQDIPAEAAGTVIEPVLDVLAKAAAKLGSVPRIDMVILNGGMSRLYLIRERLEAFFGFPMTVVSDPDLSVARGAAIYHYYLRRGLMAASHGFLPQEQAERTAPAGGSFRDVTRPVEVKQQIRTSATVLSEDIYLGLRGGAVKLLAAAGQDLPFESEVISGFGLPPQQDRLCIPIREKHGEEYVTIARGGIRFERRFPREMPVSIRFSVSRSGLLSFSAWVEGESRCSGTTEMALGAEQAVSGVKKGKNLAAPAGTVLSPANELSALKALLRQKKNKNRSARIRQAKNSIRTCGNPADFADGLMRLMREMFHNDDAMMNLLPLARALCPHWNVAQSEELLRFAMGYLDHALKGFPHRGPRISADNEAIRIIAACGTADDVRRLEPLCPVAQYEMALLAAFASAGVKADWVCERFENALAREKELPCTEFSRLQEPLRAVGMVFYNRCDDAAMPAQADTANAVLDLIDCDISTDMSQNNQNILAIALAATGLICAPAADEAPEMAAVREDAFTVLNDHLPKTYSEEFLAYCGKSIRLCHTLLSGTPLDESEEDYLLSLLTAA